MCWFVISEHLCVAQSAYHLDLLLAQILVQHIRAILPDLKARISTQIIMLQKELASYGEVTDSKVNWISFLICSM
jgi:hypothetical protein